tara:strand:- start:244 stop:492 length:249 start_codon:yes stop_codon:yes gene_type:complete
MNNDILFADGFDDAVIGIVHRCGMPPVVLYDEEKCIEIIMRDGASRDSAIEYFYFNVAGSYVGKDTPCFARLSREEAFNLDK